MRYRSTNKLVALKSYNTTQQRDKVADQPETNAAWMTHFSKKKAVPFLFTAPGLSIVTTTTANVLGSWILSVSLPVGK